MEKESGVLKKSVAGFELGMLVVSLFAFSFTIYSIDVVSGAGELTFEQELELFFGDGDLGGSSKLNTVSNVEVASGTLARTSTLVAKNTLTATTIGKETILIEKGTTIALAGDGSGTVLVGGETYILPVEQVTAAQEAGNFGLPTSKGFLSSKLGLAAGSGWDAIVTGAQWAAIAYMAGMLIGGLFGMTEANTEALSTSLAGGFGLYKGFSTWDATSGHWISNPLVGIGIGAIIFISMYKDVDIEVVTFDCLAWQAPTGGNDCEVCNDDDLPCSEYRCKALGQACEIVNVGSVDERCVYVNPRDVVPPIVRPWVEALSSGHDYTNVKTSPPGPGFEIVNLESGDGCLKAFTALEFGLVVDEPAQCKIDFEHSDSFDEMSAYVGGSNLYAYEHKERFSLPSAEAFKNSSLVLENGKDLTLFVRCKDKNGNANEAEYAVKLCVDPTPDSTAPKIEATSVINGGCVAGLMG